MLQLICHLVGDYILQTDKMARLKTQHWLWALIHAFFYTIPFALCMRFGLFHKSLIALNIIFITHAIIDRLGLAKYVIRAKNMLGDWQHRADFNTPMGYSAMTPPGLALALFIITDNTLHLIINAVALRLF